MLLYNTCTSSHVRQQSESLVGKNPSSVSEGGAASSSRFSCTVTGHRMHVLSGDTGGTTQDCWTCLWCRQKALFFECSEPWTSSTVDPSLLVEVAGQPVKIPDSMPIFDAPPTERGEKESSHCLPKGCCWINKNMEFSSCEWPRG